MKKRIVSTLVLVLSLLLCMGVSFADEEIKVGAGQPITGRFAFAGKHIHQGLMDSLDYANEQGGVGGKKFKYIYEDTGYDLMRAIASFKKIMAQDNPVMMYGESTGVGKAMAPEINSRYHVLYGSTSFSEELADREKNPYTFVSGPTYSQQFGVLLKYIAGQPKKNNKPHRVAFFYSDTEFGRDPIPFARKLAGELGIEVVAEEVTKVGAVDITSQLLDLKRNKPDYCIFQGYVVPPIPEVIRGAKDFGLDITFMGTFWAMSKMLLDKLGPDAEGYMGVCPYAYWYMDDVPMIKTIQAYNKKHYPDETYKPNSYMQGWFTGMVYVKLAQMCHEAGLPITGENLKDMLPKVNNWDTGGLNGVVSFSKSNATASGKVYKAQGGKFVAVSDWIKLDE
ncbi:MAG: ABC transporter substrate-binding protein [Deltaproteobacteria bacterium]|uniref:ABC transporter substrate-binding protein n=1 Tax=Desulfobacula sp. TaxID=2593537 RepID=UPI001984C59F|nr:ABC transporter substrate-binding protein [Candidatus Desulfobacula maris]MBL6994599.1 ABC transporter substrate-binding protein [Desulfobacula sp.]